jgi:hypothetical protein
MLGGAHAQARSHSLPAPTRSAGIDSHLETKMAATTGGSHFTLLFYGEIILHFYRRAHGYPL